MRIASVLLLAILASTCRAEDPIKKVFVDNLFLLELPIGFEWTKVKEMDADGVKARFYVAQKDASPLRYVLSVELSPRKDDPHRIAALKGHYNGLTEQLKQAKFTRLMVKEPTLKTPVADEVPFAVSAKTPDGQQVALFCVSIFKRNTYLLQCITEPADGVEDQLLQLAKRLEEPNP